MESLVDGIGDERAQANWQHFFSQSDWYTRSPNSPVLQLFLITTKPKLDSWYYLLMLRSFVLCSLSLVLISCDGLSVSWQEKFATLDEDWLVTPDEAYGWASVKNDNLPTMTGSPEWLNYMAFLEEKLLEYEVKIRVYF